MKLKKQLNFFRPTNLKRGHISEIWPNERPIWQPLFSVPLNKRVKTFTKPFCLPAGTDLLYLQFG